MDRQRKLRWSRNNPPTKEQIARRIKKKRSLQVERGIKINEMQRENISWYSPPDPDWLLRVAIPFSYEMSKNHIWALQSKGHVYLRQESRAAREQLAWAIKKALLDHKQKIVQAKLWIDIFVQKPNHKGDAVNVVDLVCDAVKDATGLDDRWYCIRALDWQIVKENPQLFVGISQTDNEDQKVCSFCGRILPLSVFKEGRRECPDCRKGAHR